jgi:hypothetical protein
MPKYLIEGKTIQSETPLTEAEIDEIAASITEAFSGLHLNLNQLVLL